MIRSAWLLAGGAIAAAIALPPPAAAQTATRVRVGDGPFISAGGFYIARDKGYFSKMGIEIETKSFPDGALAIPAMVSGELEIAAMTASAGLFNSVAKGAPMVVVLDRGHNRPGFGYTVVNVRQALWEQGVRSVADFGQLKGKRIGVGALGSINQYDVARALLKAGLDPAKDVQWLINIPQPDLMKMLGQGQVDVTDLAYQFGLLAQNNKWGPIVANGDQIAPNAQLATYAVRKDFLQRNRETVLRWAIAYLQGVKELNAAAVAPDKHPDIVAILAKNTAINNPDLIRTIAPNWSYSNEDGLPMVDSIMEMQDFWSGPHFSLVERKVTREQLLDLSIAREAKARLDKEKPFGN